MDHPNIVRLIDTREVAGSGRFGIIMEFCQRGSLQQLIFDSNITYSMKTVVSWAQELFDALNYMFERQDFIHRDIKPDNVLVTDGFHLKFGDFGSGRRIKQSCSGTFVGTQRYMSPPQLDVTEGGTEQLRTGQQVSQGNDVYSLGLVLWEVTERRIVFSEYEMMSSWNRQGGFDRDTFLFDILRKRLNGLEPPKCQVEIQAIVEKCTNFDRRLRPGALETLDELKDIDENDSFIKMLDLLPIENKNQEELLRPLGFNGQKEWITIEDSTDIEKKHSFIKTSKFLTIEDEQQEELALSFKNQKDTITIEDSTTDFDILPLNAPITIDTVTTPLNNTSNELPLNAPKRAKHPQNTVLEFLPEENENQRHPVIPMAFDGGLNRVEISQEDSVEAVGDEPDSSTIVESLKTIDTVTTPLNNTSINGLRNQSKSFVKRSHSKKRDLPILLQSICCFLFLLFIISQGAWILKPSDSNILKETPPVKGPNGSIEYLAPYGKKIEELELRMEFFRPETSQFWPSLRASMKFDDKSTSLYTFDDQGSSVFEYFKGNPVLVDSDWNISGSWNLLNQIQACKVLKLYMNFYETSSKPNENYSSTIEMVNNLFKNITFLPNLVRVEYFLISTNKYDFLKVIFDNFSTIVHQKSTFELRWEKSEAFFFKDYLLALMEKRMFQQLQIIDWDSKNNFSSEVLSRAHSLATIQRADIWGEFLTLCEELLEKGPPSRHPQSIAIIHSKEKLAWKDCSERYKAIEEVLEKTQDLEHITERAQIVELRAEFREIVSRFLEEFEIKFKKKTKKKPVTWAWDNNGIKEFFVKPLNEDRQLVILVRGIETRQKLYSFYVIGWYLAS